MTNFEGDVPGNATDATKRVAQRITALLAGTAAEARRDPHPLDSGNRFIGPTSQAAIH